jgi:class 3 adenylate cyclase
MVPDGRSGVSGERRPLTILFCDLVGSTPLSERLDPEDYADVVFEYQERGRLVIEHHGGGIVAFAGDGIIASFGHPIAHEDDAERAVDAGLGLVAAVAALQRTIGVEHAIDLRCRVGLHADVAVVGRMAGHDEVSLFGSVANIAARVQSEAGAGEVLVTDAVLALLADSHQVADHRHVALKGVAAPVGVARLTGRAPAGVRRRRVRMVGRQRERAELERHRHDARTGRGGAVVICGPAGIGKSTLLADLLGSEVAGTWIEVRARQLAGLTPFGPLADLAAELARAAPAGGTLAAAAAKLAARIEATADNTTVSSEHAWQLVIEASRAVGRSLDGRLVVVEDAHWLDASSLAALEALVAELGATSSLLVATTRPPSPLPTTPVVELGPLGPVDLAALVGAVLDADADAASAGAAQVAAIVARSEGIPLYAAELARAAGSGGDGALPHSLHGSLLARLDRAPALAAPARAASVLGDEIDVALLAAVMEVDDAVASASIDDLVAGELVRRDPPRPATFVHALLREAVYSSLLQRERRAMHARVAAALTAVGGRADDRAALCGHHLEQAAERRDAAACFATAARRSARRGAVAEALALADRGLALVVEDGAAAAIALSLTMTKGNARLAVDGYAAPGLDRLWQDAEVLARMAGDDGELSSAMNGQSVAALFDGDYVLAIDRAERVRSLGVRTGDRAALVRGHCSLAVPQLFRGDVTAALDNARAAIDLYRVGDDQLLTYGFGTDHGVIARSFAGMAGWFAGAHDAADLLASSIVHAEEIQSPISLCLALQQAATIDLAAGDHAAALDRAARCEDTARRYGLPFYVALGQLARAAAGAWLGEPGAVDLAGDALGELVHGTSAMGTTLGLMQLAICQAGAGNPTTAAGTAQYGLRLARGAGELIFEVELALLAATATSTDEAWTDVERAATTAEGRGAFASAARARAALAPRAT